jgi:hypothetical protein
MIYHLVLFKLKPEADEAKIVAGLKVDFRWRIPPAGSIGELAKPPGNPADKSSGASSRASNPMSDPKSCSRCRRRGRLFPTPEGLRERSLIR